MVGGIPPTTTQAQLHVCCLLRHLPPITALGALPAGTLDHLPTIGERMSTEPVEATATLSIDTGLPPVPFKLVKHIQAGEFPDVGELLPDRLGIRTESTDKDDKKPTLKKRQVTGIQEWVPCYCIYTAVVLAKYPEQNQDMLGYRALIVEACTEYEEDSWLGYDSRFRQMVAATPGTTWAKIEPTRWNMEMF